MPTKHEQIVDALVAAITTRMAADIGADVAVIRSAPEAQAIEAAAKGLVNIVEEATVETDRVFGVSRRYMQARLTAEIVVTGSTAADRDARLDAVYAAIGAALDADRTLGGLADYLDIGGPGAAINALWMGAADIKAGSIQIAVDYSTSDNPLA